MNDFKSSRLQRLAKLSSGIAKASTQLALDYAAQYTKEKAQSISSKITEKEKDVQELSRKVKATKELIQTMGQMKGALMKLGQMISITEDMFLPKEITDLFKELQRNAPAMSNADIDRVFQRNFKKKPEEVFKFFDRTPLASASIGQVHVATLNDDTKVAVKIQYPEIVEAIRSDFKNIHHLNKLIEILYPKKPNLDEFLEELRTSLMNECDYEFEKNELIKFKELYKNEFPQIVVPKVFGDYSTKEILTMEYLDGKHFDETLSFSKAARNFLGQSLYEKFLYSLWVAGTLHTDPQNGNYLFTENQIKLLDFGSTRTFSEEFLIDYCTLILAVEINNFELYQIACEKLKFFKQDEPIENIQKHYQMVHNLYDPYLKEGTYAVVDLNPLKLLKEFTDGLEMKGRQSPRREFLLLDRSNLGLFTKLKYWGAEVNWRAGNQRYRSAIEAKVKALYPSHFP